MLVLIRMSDKMNGVETGKGRDRKWLYLITQKKRGT